MLKTLVAFANLAEAPTDRREDGTREILGIGNPKDEEERLCK